MFHIKTTGFDTQKPDIGTEEKLGILNIDFFNEYGECYYPRITSKLNLIFKHKTKIFLNHFMKASSR